MVRKLVAAASVIAAAFFMANPAIAGTHIHQKRDAFTGCGFIYLTHSNPTVYVESNGDGHQLTLVISSNPSQWCPMATSDGSSFKIHHRVNGSPSSEVIQGENNGNVVLEPNSSGDQAQEWKWEGPLPGGWFPKSNASYAVYAKCDTPGCNVFEAFLGGMWQTWSYSEQEAS